MATPRWLLIAFVLLGSVACAGKAQSRTAEVAASVACTPPECASATDIQATLGFQALEPQSVPTGFGLTARKPLINQLPPQIRQTIATQQGIPLASVPESVPSGLTVEYRFAASSYVPAITIFEEKADTATPSLEIARTGCAEKLQSSGVSMIYGIGKGSIDRGPTPGAWLVCAQVDSTDPKAYVAFFTRGDVIVQVRALPEANITRDQFIKMASSFKPAS